MLKTGVGRGGRRARTSVRLTAAVTASLVTLGVISAAWAAAPASASAPQPKVAAKYHGKAMHLDTPEPGAPWKPSPMKAPAQGKPIAITATTFPAAGTADVTLAPEAATHANAASGNVQASGSAQTSMVKAGGLPVFVGSASEAAAAGAAQEKNTLTTAASAPTKVTVTVAGHAAASAAGVTGAIVSVARADGKTVSGRATVGIDYSSFAQAFGGDLPDRLKLVSLPACALTTPKVAACDKQTPVTYTNDVAAKKLTATVTIPGAAQAPSGSAAASAATAGAPRLVLAATSAPSGPTGDYTATSLSSSATWGTSGDTGSFTYSYPITVPQALGGAAPDVALGYDSGSVDGKTAIENSQTSWVGEGWDYSPGYIERTYTPCAKAKPAAFATGDNCFVRDASGNLLPSLTMSFGTHGGQLVPTDGTDQHFVLPTDDGTQIDQMTGIANGSATGEFYRVHMPDGSTAYFGAGMLPADAGGSNSTGVETGSAWTEPVFNDPSRSGVCLDPTKVTDPTAATSNCMQVWRWNLDFVIDPNGNVTMYDYAPESNYYGRGTANKPTWYDRGGVLSEIDYGWQAADVVASSTRHAAAKVTFTSANRCVDPNTDGGYHLNDPVTHQTNGAGPAGCGATPFEQYSASMMDTPIDQGCPQSATTCELTSPTFWSTRRLAGITTAVSVNGTYQNVDHWDLFDQFHTLDTPLSPLWLAAIRRCAASAVGSNGVCPQAVNGTANQASLPDVQFAPASMAQRVPGVTGANVPTNLPVYDRERISGISGERGSTTVVNYDVPSSYSPLACTAPPSGPADWHNTQLCFPEYWTAPNTAGPFTDWFNKYVVTSVIEQDNAHAANVNASVVSTSYTYNGGAAWHSNDSELLFDPNSRTYDQWRGFSSVTKTIGSGSDSPTKTITYYLRGMDQDPDKAAATAGACDATGLTQKADCTPISWIEPLSGATITDDNALAGRAWKTETYNGSSATTAYSTTVDIPWISPPVAEHLRTKPLPALRSRQLGTAQDITSEPLASGHNRITETDNWYGRPGGRLIYSSILAPRLDTGGPVPGDTSPQLCAETDYATGKDALGNVESWMVAYPSAVTTRDAPCLYSAPAYNTYAAPSQLNPGAVVDATATVYDGASGTVTKGNVTETDVQSGTSAVPGPMVMQSQKQYDGYGRVIKSVAGVSASTTATTTTVYNPATQELPTSIDVAGPDAAGNPNWHTVTTYDPTRMLPQIVTDINGRKTFTTHDALGRTSAVWLPGRTTSTTYPPQIPANVKYSYTINGYIPGSASTVPPSFTETDTLREDGNTYSSTTTLTDSLGRVRQVQTTPTSDDNGRVISDTVYDTLGRVSTVTGPDYDPTSSPSGSMWVPSSPSAPSTQVQTLYDGLGRTTDVVTQAHASELWRTSYKYYGVDAVETIPPAGGVHTSVLHDARGGQIALYTYHPGAVFTDSQAAQIDPTKIDTVLYGYDDAGRLSRVDQVVDATHSNTWNYGYDLQGRRIAGHDPDAGNSTYGYDVIGDLTDVTGAQLSADGTTPQSLHYTYDALGRRTAEYNGLGTAAVQSTNTLASWSYDSAPALNSTQVAANPGSDTYGNLGRPAGSIRYSSDHQQYTESVAGYDALGEPLSTTVGIPTGDGNGPLAGSYTTVNHYTALGQLSSTDLPTGGDLQPDTIGFGYDHNGLMYGVTDSYGDLVTDSAYSTFGEIQRRILGDYPNTVVQDTVRDDPTHRVSNTTISQLSWNAPIDTTAYTYNPAGQITSTVDIQGTSASLGNNGVVSTTQATDAECFHYDYADRMDAAWSDTGKVDGTVFGSLTTTAPGAGTINPYSTPAPGGIGGCENVAPTSGTTARWQIGGPAPYGQVFSYDAPTGNRTTETDYNAGGTVAETSNYHYNAPGTNQPHVLNSVGHTVGTTTTTDSYQYDAAGNTIGRDLAGKPAQTLAWDPEGALATDIDHSGAAAGFVNDADGNQLIRRDTTTTTLYLGSTELHLNLSSNQVTGQRRFSYDGAPTITETGGASPKISYEAGTPQGTAQTVIDASPNTADQALTARRDYTPFSTPRGTGQSGVFGTFADDHTFLGDSTDIDTGLVDIGARKYDPTIGRFVSADPLLDLNQPSTINGYTYAGADPVNATDPTGLDGCAPDFANSFVGATKVLMGDGTSKPISQVKVGDKVASAVPGGSGTQVHTVTELHITDTDRDFTTLTIKSGKSVGKLTGTSHHIFYDLTAKAWVPAGDLKPGDVLQTPDGTAVVLAVSNFTQSVRTYNLTIDGLHTYFVEAGDIPTLVHNCNDDGPIEYGGGDDAGGGGGGGGGGDGGDSSSESSNSGDKSGDDSVQPVSGDDGDDGTSATEPWRQSKSKSGGTSGSDDGRSGSSDGQRSAVSGDNGSGNDENPHEVTPEGIEKIRKTIETLRARGDKPTTGVPLDKDGDQIGPERRSKMDAMSRYISRILRTLMGRDNGDVASAEHAEPKIAVWMNQDKIKYAHVAIDQKYVCGGDGPDALGCRDIIPQILNKGRTMTIWYIDGNGQLQRTPPLEGRR
ncbi:DddA-like double-stranded DNA deaminase toxin [Catenulispora sp. GP43]|uniref:DddA-like double-stranded DNA deaminase toxin n=1 Tax=Catenulispora sp. GP43 TaxID=3156263 RepID=UPI00351352DE